VADKIEVKLGPAVESMESMLEAGKAETFDLIFIDADKPNYINYYELSLKLLRKGGVIAIDNVLWHGRVLDPEDKEPSTNIMRELNQKILSDKRVLMTMLPISDGLTLCYKL